MDKVETKSQYKCFVGNAKYLKAYKPLDVDSNVIMESKDIDFIKDKYLNDSNNDLDLDNM
jgi:hypothetical protein